MLKIEAKKNIKNNQNIHNQDICSLFVSLLVTHYWNLREVLINKYFLSEWMCLSKMMVWIDSLQVMGLPFQYSWVQVCASMSMSVCVYVSVAKDQAQGLAHTGKMLYHQVMSPSPHHFCGDTCCFWIQFFVVLVNGRLGNRCHPMITLYVVVDFEAFSYTNKANSLHKI